MPVPRRSPWARSRSPVRPRATSLREAEGAEEYEGDAEEQSDSEEYEGDEWDEDEEEAEEGEDEEEQEEHEEEQPSSSASASASAAAGGVFARLEAFRILGLPLGSDKALIRRRFLQECLRCHPDKGGNVADFVTMRMAYSQLQ